MVPLEFGRMGFRLNILSVTVGQLFAILHFWGSSDSGGILKSVFVSASHFLHYYKM